jgi:large exoprotein involved in heme utilization and adhesion
MGWEPLPGFGSLTFGAGKAGDVSVITSGPVTIDHGLAKNTSTGIGSLTFGKGSAGDVSLKSLGMVSASDGGPNAPTGIFAVAEIGSTGNSGSVTVTAGNLSIANAGLISASTFGSGDAGNVTVSITDKLTIDGAMAPAVTGIVSQASGRSRGNAGNLTVDAGSLYILNSGVISSSTFAPGKAADVTVSVAGGLTIDGTLTPSSSFTGIASQADKGPTGNAGAVTVSAGGAIALFGGGRVSTGTVGEGDGGTVSVTAQGPLILSGPNTGIFASALPNSSGNAGSVFVVAPQIELTSGARIANIMAGSGAGGSVTVTTPGALVLDGAGDPDTRIAASATTPQSGRGGSVKVQANSLTIEGSAQIASTTAGPTRAAMSMSP